VNFATAPDGARGANQLLIPELLLFALHLATAAVMVVLGIVYVRDAHRNRELAEDKRKSWATALFMGNLFVMPVYWWKFLRPGPTSRRG